VINGAQESVLLGPGRHLLDHLEPVGRESQIGVSETLSVQQTSNAGAVPTL
jgi:hypothetical protein